MALPSLPDRSPMFDANGYPTLQTRVWWQSVQRAYQVQDAAIAALDARVTALEP